MSQNPPSVDLAAVLAADSNVGLTYGTDLFVHTMPPKPDACVCLYDAPGEAPDSHLEYQRPSVQVRVRGNAGGYLAAHAIAQAVRDCLDGTSNFTQGLSRYIIVTAETDIGTIGEDDNNRPLLSIGFRIHRTPSS